MAALEVPDWRWFAVRGGVALIFGLLALFAPSMILAVLITIFGVFVLLDGIFAIVSAIGNRRERPRWIALLVEGVLGIVIGLFALLVPDAAAIAVVYVVAVWALVTGIAKVVAAIRLREIIAGEWMLALAGALSIVLGVALVVYPGVGALALVVWIGAYATLFGVLLLVLGFRLRRWRHERGEYAARRA